ncbi:MAG: LacI family DNA-binding transcriptional regulator [Candidatus Ratteibacteria bacterium]|jgi:LacI family transcriptional regulator
MKITRKAVAGLAGVSLTTVSDVLNRTPDARISEETRKKVLWAVKKLDYQPDSLARGLVLQKSFNIGILICQSKEGFPLLKSLFTFEVLRGVQAVLKDSNYRVSFFSANNLREFDYKTLFSKKWVDGLIMLEMVFSDLEILESDAKRERRPIIVLNDRLPATRLNYVDIDNEGGVFQAMAHLVRLGYKKIGFVSGPQNQSNFVERLDAYKTSLKKYGLNYDPEIVIKKRPEDYGRIIDKWLVRRKCPQAIFAGSDAIAIEIIQVLKKRGLSIPKDVAIIGFDDIEISSRLDPPLTTVRQPMYEIGAFAARELIDILEHKNIRRPVRKIFPTKLVVRESCGVKLKKNKEEVE